MLTSETRVDAMHRIGRALSDPTRARILLQLIDGPAYPADLAETLGLGRTNVSNHLACLRGCGVVIRSSHGRQTSYEIADPHLTRALTSLVDVVLAVDEGTVCEDDCSSPLCCAPDAVDIEAAR